MRDYKNQRLIRDTRAGDIVMAVVGVFSLGVVFGLLLAWRG